MTPTYPNLGAFSQSSLGLDFCHRRSRQERNARRLYSLNRCASQAKHQRSSSSPISPSMRSPTSSPSSSSSSRNVSSTASISVSSSAAAATLSSPASASSSGTSTVPAPAGGSSSSATAG